MIKEYSRKRHESSGKKLDAKCVGCKPKTHHASTAYAALITESNASVTFLFSAIINSSEILDAQDYQNY